MTNKAATNGYLSFLEDVELRPLSLENTRGLQPVGLALGKGQGALEVAITQSSRQPAQATMPGRAGGRAPVNHDVSQSGRNVL